jgi:threonine dehydrogenase-like Zn-dependent dehydrogenase
VLGILERDGAFAEYLRLPDRNLLVVPDSISDEMAVFVEPLAAAYEIFEQTKIPRTHRILVLGDGRLGILVALAMRAEGYDAIIAGHHPERAQSVGIEAQRERDLIDRFDVVVDCTGSTSGFARAVELVRPRGTLILKSTIAGGAAFNLAPIVINEITVLGSRCGQFAQALDRMASGKIDPRALISAIFPLKDGIAALDAAVKPSNLKVLLKPS